MKEMEGYRVNSNLKFYVKDRDITFIRHNLAGYKKITLSEEEIKKINKLVWSDKEDKNE